MTWEIVERNWAETAITENGNPIAWLSIYDEATEENQLELQTQMANHAKLIASAPDLLAALKRICDWIDAGCDPSAPSIQKAKQAIQKATSNE